MTDNEIIKALECCFLSECDCKDCPYRDFEICDTAKMINTVIDLFNRRQEEREALIAGQETLQKHIAEQKAEIERLKKAIEVKDNIYQRNTGLREKRIFDLMDELKTAKSEAIKEFAVRLKCGVPQETGVIRCADVDNFVKEVTWQDK